MWSLSHTWNTDRTVRRSTALDGEKPLSYEQVIQLWADDQCFGRFFASELSGFSAEAFYWETRRLKMGDRRHPFEFVQIAAPALSFINQDSNPFAEHFSRRGSDDMVSVFKNLRRDATLIAPAPVKGLTCFAHFATFLRGAPERNMDALWKAVGTAMSNEMSECPLWLSTAGLGVSWLHLRIDKTPKYYRYTEFK